MCIGWLKIDGMFKYYMSMLVLRVLATSNPPYLRSKLVFRRELHNVNVRNVDNLALPCFRLSFFQAFLYI
nr:unnamed protein product [Callosobruchus analis]